MEEFHLACGQITWDRSYPADKVPQEIARAGYEGALAVEPFGTVGPAWLRRFMLETGA